MMDFLLFSTFCGFQFFAWRGLRDAKFLLKGGVMDVLSQGRRPVFGRTLQLIGIVLFRRFDHVDDSVMLEYINSYRFNLMSCCALMGFFYLLFFWPLFGRLLD
jgi:hypothetical protein